MTSQKEVKESNWLEELSSFDILVGYLGCELVLELASMIEERTYARSFIVEERFSLSRRL